MTKPSTLTSLFASWILLLAIRASRAEAWSYGLALSDSRVRESSMALYSSRRQVLQRLWGQSAVTTIAVNSLASLSLASFPTEAAARNLPQSTGADASQTGTIGALVPIVKMRQTLDAIIFMLSSSQGGTLHDRTLISDYIKAIPANEQVFKRVFDAYSTPVSYKQKFMDQNAFLVYYTKGYDGPNRPLLEDGDGEEQLQTMQFGYRNDAWIAWEAFALEFQYPDADVIELKLQMRRATAAMDAYLDLVPLGDLQIARERTKG